ncbi:hypothetical protein b3_0369 [Synechococcus phage B3]|jgi:hypothetical protein|nr:hypothetical protein b3_0369 [Synechococcus phage B3]QGT54969.1 hypothetical protein b23_0363 [Synechococcus phage B23]
MEKKCIRCNNIKSINNFSTSKRGTRNVCKECINLSSRIVNNLKKTAPPKPVPEVCQCCRKKSKLVLDHCHETSKFRGWICHQCNMAIGNLGDNIAGLMNAVLYLAECHETK